MFRAWKLVVAVWAVRVVQAKVVTAHRLQRGEGIANLTELNTTR